MAFERLYQLSPVLGSAQDSFSEQLWSQGLFLVSVDDKPKTTPPTKGPGEKSPDYYANVGDAIRTLREDVPRLFEQDLNCECRQQQGLEAGASASEDAVTGISTSTAMPPGVETAVLRLDVADICVLACQWVAKLRPMFMVPAGADAIITNQHRCLPLPLHV